MRKLALSIFLLVCTTLAQAQVTVREAWVRGTVPMQKASGAFMQLNSDKNVRLVGAKSPVAAVVEIHEMVMDKDVMKMREVPGIDIVPGRVLELKPGGYHVMLIDLKSQLKGGESVPLTLTFEDSSTKARFTQEVSAPVKALGSPTGHEGMKH